MPARYKLHLVAQFVGSGTTRQLAESLATIAQDQSVAPLEQTHGPKEARGVTIDGTQVHSVRLPGYVIAFETIFGLPSERLSIRHDAGSSAEPYVSGTLLAARKVMEISGPSTRIRPTSFFVRNMLAKPR